MTTPNYVVTIAREYGSGGRLIGKKLAEMLGIAFYDKEIITLAAEDSGLSEDFLKEHDQNKKKISLFSNTFISAKSLPISEQIYLAQCKVIRDVAAKSSCVIVGRCADHVLAEHPYCVKTFIHAPEAEKIRRIKEFYREDIENPAAYAAKIDKERAAHYNYFTLGKWGDLRNYNLTIDSTIGVDAAVRVIKEYVEQFLQK